MWFRRRLPPQIVVLEPEPDESVRVVRDLDVQVGVPAVRLDRVVQALAVHAHHLEDRLVHLEALVGEQAEEQASRPTHADVLDVRLQATQVSGDLSRLATELRAEIAEIKDESDRSAGASAREVRLAALAEELLDLTRQAS